MTAKDILKTVADTGARYIRLVDPSGSILIPANNPKASIEDRAKSMEKVFQSNVYPDGTYYLEIMQNSKSVGTRIPFQKGKEITEPSKVAPAFHSSYDDTKIVTLLTELHNKIETLEGQLSDNDYEDSNQEAPVNQFAWLSDMVPVVVKGIDRWFDIQDKKLLSEKSAPGANVSNNRQSEADRLIHSFSFMGTPENIDKFMEDLNQNDPELAAIIINTVNKATGQ